MAETEAAKQAVWLQELLAEIVGKECEKVVVRIDNKSAIALTKNPVFHGGANIYIGAITSFESVLTKI